MPLPGWVYVLTCPTFPGCCKIGGTGRTATHRAAELVAEYESGQPFSIVERVPVSDWPAVEASAHRMLSDRRVPRSELFRCQSAEAVKVVRAAAKAHARPSLFRRLAVAPSRVARSSGYSRRRRGTNWLPVLLLLSIAAAVLSIAKPAPPSWLPLPLAGTVALLERL